MSEKENQIKENKMGTMPEGRLLFSMALPMIISMLVLALYNIVDSIFVAKLSEDALTAVSMAFPMQNLLIGMGTGIGVGTNALLSRFLGQKRPDLANKVALNGIFLTFCAYLLFLVLGLTISRPFFVWQGANDVIADYGQQYLSIILCVSIGCYMQTIFERLLQATGRTILSMTTQLTGAIINIILDPIMIFGLLGCPAMGIRGAAIATVIGQCVACLFAITLNLKFNKELDFHFAGFRPMGRMIKDILLIGVPSIIMVAIGSVMTFLINLILSIYFTSTAVAVFGVYYKLQSFTFMPVFGLNNGMVPIIGYNFGARRPDRIMKTLKLAIASAVCIMIFGMLLIQIFPTNMLGLFSASQDMLSIGVPALRIMTTSYIFAGFCIICGSAFQALGNGLYSTIVSFTRQLIFLVPLAFIFAQTANLERVWLAWPIAEVASLVVTSLFLHRILRKVIRPLANS